MFGARNQLHIKVATDYEMPCTAGIRGREKS